MKKIDSCKKKSTLNIIKVFSYLLLAFAFLIVGSFNIKVSAKEETNEDVIVSEPVEAVEDTKKVVSLCSKALLAYTHYEKSSFSLSDDETYVAFFGVVCDNSGSLVSIATEKYCVTTSTSCTPTILLEDGKIELPSTGTKFYIKVYAYKSGSSTVEADISTTITRSTPVIAKIGDTAYSSLNAALTAASTNAGATVVLQKNTSECITMSNGSFTIIDLNGYTWSCSNTTFSMTGTGVYELKNGTIKSTSTSSSYAAISLSSGTIQLTSNLNVESSTKGVSVTSGSLYLGKSKSCTDTAYPSITVSGTAAIYQTYGTVYMYCGTAYNSSSNGVYISGSNAKFYAYYGFIYGALSGANIRAGAYFELNGSSNTSRPYLLGKTNGAYLYGTSSTQPTLYLKEGFIASASNYSSYLGRNNASYTNYIVAAGNGELSLEDYSTNYQGTMYYGKTIQKNVVVNNSAYYSTLSSALSSLGSSTTTNIKLLSDVSECITVSTTVKAVIDLNGKTWSCSSSSSSTLYISGGSSNTSIIEINDTSSNASGVLKSTANFAIKVEFTGSLKIYKGTIQTTSSSSNHDAIYVLNHNSTVIFGDRSSTTSNLKIKGNMGAALFIVKGTITINNGLFDSSGGTYGIYVSSATINMYKGIIYGKPEGIRAASGASLTIGNEESYSGNLRIIAKGSSSSYGLRLLSGSSANATTATFRGGFIGTASASYSNAYYTDSSYASFSSSGTLMNVTYDSYYGKVSAATSIGSTYYETIQDAIEALNTNTSGATNKTIKLLKSFEYSDAVVSNKIGTIDLNGYTWSASKGAISMINNSDITITNSGSIIGTITSGSYETIVVSGGKLTLLKGRITNTWVSAVEITSGSFYIGNETFSPSVSQAKVETSSEDSSAILVGSSGYFYMYGGMVETLDSNGNTSNEAIEIVNGTATIYAGNVTGVSGAISVSSTQQGKGVLTVGSVNSTTGNLQIISNTGYAVALVSNGGNPRLSFNSGFLGSNDGYSYAYNDVSGVTVDLAGATMNVKVGGITGKTIEAAHIGSTQYATLSSAFSALTTTEKTLTIGRSINECVSMPSAKKVRIDLNGKTWSCSASSSSTLYVSSSSTITIIDSSSTNGYMVSTKNNTISWESGYSGALKIYSGRIIAPNGTALYLQGFPTVTIGDYSSNVSNLQIWGSQYAVNSTMTANVTVNSGRLYAYGYNAINSNGGTLTVGDTYSNIDNLQIHMESGNNAVNVTGSAQTGGARRFIFNGGFIGNTTGSSVYNINDASTTSCASYVNCEYSGDRMTTTITVGVATYTGRTIVAAHIYAAPYARLQDAFDQLTSYSGLTITIGRNITESVNIDSTVLVSINLNGKVWDAIDEATLTIEGGNFNTSTISIHDSVGGGKINGYEDYHTIYANFAGSLSIDSGIFYHVGQGEGATIFIEGILSSSGSPLTEVTIGYTTDLQIVNDDYEAINVENTKLNINKGLILGYVGIIAGEGSEVVATGGTIIGRNFAGIRAMTGAKITIGDDSSSADNLKVISLCSGSRCPGVSLYSSNSSYTTSITFNNGFIGSADGYTICSDTNYTSITTGEYYAKTTQYYDGEYYKGYTISSSPAAHIGNIYYNTLADAISDLSASTTTSTKIVLDRDNDECISILSAKIGTIDLNSYIWNCTDQRETLLLDTGSSNSYIVIEDNSQGHGEIRHEEDGAVIGIDSISIVVLKSGAISLTTYTQTYGVSITDGAEFILDGGYILDNMSTPVVAYVNYGHMNIKSGTIISDNDLNIDSFGIVTLGDKEDKTKRPVIVNTAGQTITNKGTLNFYGGYLYSPQSYSTGIDNSGTINYRTTSGTEIVNSLSTYNGTTMRLTTVATYIIQVASTGEKYEELRSFASIISRTTTTTETIKLLNNIDNEQLTITSLVNGVGNNMTKLTIDLNGKTWSSDSTAIFVRINSTGTIVIKDSVGGGIIKGGNQTIDYENSDNSGLVIESGTIMSNGGAAISAIPGLIIGSETSNSTVDNTRVIGNSSSYPTISTPVIKMYGGFVGNSVNRDKSYNGGLNAASGTIVDTTVTISGVKYLGYTVAETPAAYIDNNGIKTYYATLSDAFDALNSSSQKTIVLNSNVEEYFTLSRTVKAIIDLNGKTWTGYFGIRGTTSNTSTITITDSTSSVGGITNPEQGDVAIVSDFSGTLTILKGIYSSDGSTIYITKGTVKIGDENSSISNLQIKGGNNSGEGAVYIKGGATLTINGGLIKGGYEGIYIDNNATVSINRGYVVAVYTGILVDTQDGDTIKLTIGDTTTSTYSNLKVLASTTGSDARAVLFLTRSGENLINNATFTWNDGFLGTCYKDKNYTYDFTYSAEPITFNVNSSWQMNTTTTYNGNTYYGKALAVASIGSTYYLTLSSAYNAMSGNKITLLRNANNEYISTSVTRTGTIDLNGKIWKYSNGTPFWISGGSGTITITSSATGGSIVGSTYAIYVGFSGTLNIDKGILISKGYNTIYAAKGNINIGNTSTSNVSNTKIINASTTSTSSTIYFSSSSTAVVKFYNGFIGGGKVSSSEPWTYSPFDVSKLSSYTGKIVYTFSTYDGVKYAGITATNDYEVYTKYSTPNVTVYYYKLSDAIDALNSNVTSPATITVYKNISSSSSIAISETKNFTLDLNGKTISFTANVFYLSGGSANLSNITITDSSSSVGTITSTTDTIYGYFNGTINVYKGIIKTTQTASDYAVFWLNGGSPTINIGNKDSTTSNLQILNTTGGYAIYSYAANINIYAGLVVGKTRAVNYNTSSSTAKRLVIGAEYSTYDNPKVISLSTSTSDYSLYVGSGNNTTIDFIGGFIGSGAGTSNIYYLNPSSNNNFYPHGTTMDAAFDYSGTTYNGITLAAVRLRAGQNSYVYHYSLQTAIDYIPTGSTSVPVLTLIKDRINECVTITSTKNFILDLNGKTWICNKSIALSVSGSSNTSRITITDYSSGEVGTIYSPGNYYTMSLNSNSTVEINRGYIKGDNYYVIESGGNTLIIGDDGSTTENLKISLENTSCSGYHAIFGRSSSITVNGGYITSNCSSYAITDNGGSSNIIVNGGIIEGQAAGIYAGRNITITGGYIYGVTDGIRASSSNANITMSGGTVIGESGYGIKFSSQNSNPATFNFSGGYVGTSIANGASKAYINSVTSNDEYITLNIPQGSYRVVTEAEYDETTYIALTIDNSPSAHISGLDDTSKVKYYAKLKYAFEYYMKDNAPSTVILDKNIDECIRLISSIYGAINLNGKTWSCSNTTLSLEADNMNLSISDSSNGSGKITSSSAFAISAICGGLLNISSGTIESTASLNDYSAIYVGGKCSLNISSRGSVKILGKNKSRAISIVLGASVSIDSMYNYSTLIVSDSNNAIYLTSDSRLTIGSVGSSSSIESLRILSLSSSHNPIYINTGSSVTFNFGFVGGGINGNPVNTAPWNYEYINDTSISSDSKLVYTRSSYDGKTYLGVTITNDYAAESTYTTGSESTTKKYYKLSDALAVLGEYDTVVNIKLVKDINECISYNTNKGFELDLFGHTWSCNTSTKTFYIGTVTADISITDSSSDDALRGTITNTIGGQILNVSGSSVTLRLHNIVLTSDSTGATALDVEFGSVIVSSSSISAHTAIDNHSASVVIDGGSTITSSNGSAISAYYGSLTINGATINAKYYGISAYNSTITITEVTIISDSYPTISAYGDLSVLNFNGSTTYECGNAVPSVNLLSSLSGSEGSGTPGKYVLRNNTTTELKNVFIGKATSEGLYYISDNAIIPEGYSSVSYTSTVNGVEYTGVAIVESPVKAEFDGETAYYTGVQSAIEAITSEGTITLLSDISECVTTSTNKTITIDLNGYSWSNCGEHSLLLINAASAVYTIKDSSSAQTGEMRTTANTTPIRVTNQSTLNILSGTFTESYLYFISGSENAIINIGEEGMPTNVVLNVGIIEGAGYITINNGHIRNFYPYTTINLIVNGGTIDNAHFKSSFTMNGGYVKSFVSSYDGTSIMNGGTIDSITMMGGGTFTMNDGLVGKVSMTQSSSNVFTMNGGKIASDVNTYVLYIEAGATVNLNKGIIVANNCTIRVSGSSVLNFGNEESTENDLQFIKMGSAASKAAIELMSQGSTPTFNFNSGFISGTASMLYSGSGNVNIYGELSQTTVVYEGNSYSGVTPRIARIGNTYYRRLSQAFDALSSTTTEATTIVLLGNPTECISFDTTKIGTIDLNGKTWSDCSTNYTSYTNFLLRGSSSSRITITDNMQNGVGKMTTTQHAIGDIGYLKIYRGIIHGDYHSIFHLNSNSIKEIIIGNDTSTIDNLQLTSVINVNSNSPKITINNGRVSTIMLYEKAKMTMLKGVQIGAINVTGSASVTIGDKDSNCENLKILGAATSFYESIYFYSNLSGSEFNFNGGFIGHDSDRDKAYTLNSENVTYSINGVIVNKDITYEGKSYVGITVGAAYIGDDIETADKYETLEDAIEALPSNSSKTIHLAKNTSECIVINSVKNITIDLNGNVWSCAYGYALDILVDSNPTISIIGSGTIANYGQGGAIHAKFRGELKINGDIHIRASVADIYAIYIENGTITLGKDNSDNETITFGTGRAISAKGGESITCVNIYNGTAIYNSQILATNSAEINVYGGYDLGELRVESNAIAYINPLTDNSLDFALTVIGARAKIVKGYINLYVEDTDEYASSIYLGNFDNTIDNKDLVITKMTYESNGKQIRGNILFYDGVIYTYEIPEWLPNIVRNSAQITTTYGLNDSGDIYMYKTYNDPEAVVVATSRTCESRTYSSFESALDSIESSGCTDVTITLLGDTIVQGNISFGGRVLTVDFNGKIMEISSSYVDISPSYDTLRFINTSDREATIELYSNMSVHSGSLAIDNVTIKGYYDIVVESSATLMINSGKIYMDGSASIINEGTTYIGGVYGEYNPNKEIGDMPSIYLNEGSMIRTGGSDARLYIYDGEILSVSENSYTISYSEGILQIGYDGGSRYGARAIPTIKNLYGAAHGYTLIENTGSDSDIRFIMGYLIMLDDGDDSFIHNGEFYSLDYVIDRYTDDDGNSIKVLHHDDVPSLLVTNEEGGDYFDYFDHAYDYCEENCTITLLNDVDIGTVGEIYTFYKDIPFTIDLNGYSLLINALILELPTSMTNLTIINSTSIVSYIKSPGNEIKYIFNVLGGASLEILGKDISTDSTYQSNIVVLVDSSVHSEAFYIEGSDSSITTTEVSIEGSESCSALIYVDSGVYTMNGGYITSCDLAIYGSAGTTNINYGTIESYGVAVKYSSGILNIGGVLDCNSSESKLCYPIIRNINSYSTVIGASDTEVNILSGIIESTVDDTSSSNSEVIYVFGSSVLTIGNISNCDCETEIGYMPRIIAKTEGEYALYAESPSTVIMNSGALYTLASNGHENAFNSDSGIQTSYGIGTKLVTIDGKQYLVNYVDCSSRMVVEAYDSDGNKYGEYPSLMDAMYGEIREGAELRLLANINECILLDIDTKNFQINLNGHTWTCTKSGSRTLDIYNNSSDGTTIEIINGTISNINSDAKAINNNSSVYVIISNVTISAGVAIYETSSGSGGVAIKNSTINGDVIFEKNGHLKNVIINGNLEIYANGTRLCAVTVNGMTSVDGAVAFAERGSTFYNKKGNAISLSNGATFYIIRWYEDCIDSYVSIKSDNAYPIYSIGSNVVNIDGVYAMYYTGNSAIGGETENLTINIDENISRKLDIVYVDGIAYQREFHAVAELTIDGSNNKLYPSLQDAIDDYIENDEMMDGTIILRDNSCEKIVIGNPDIDTSLYNLIIDMNGNTLCSKYYGTITNYLHTKIINSSSDATYINGPVTNYSLLTIGDNNSSSYIKMTEFLDNIDAEITNYGTLVLDGNVSIASTKYGIYNNGTVKINSSNVEIYDVEYGIWNSESSSYAYINKGKIHATDTAIYNYRNVSIGSKTDNFSVTDVEIIGDKYGVYNEGNGRFYFYNGSIIGGVAYNKEPTEIRSTVTAEAISDGYIEDICSVMATGTETGCGTISYTGNGEWKHFAAVKSAYVNQTTNNTVTLYSESIQAMINYYSDDSKYPNTIEEGRIYSIVLLRNVEENNITIDGVIDRNHGTRFSLVLSEFSITSTDPTNPVIKVNSGLFICSQLDSSGGCGPSSTVGTIVSEATSILAGYSDEGVGVQLFIYDVTINSTNGSGIKFGEYSSYGEIYNSKITGKTYGIENYSNSSNLTDISNTIVNSIYTAVNSNTKIDESSNISSLDNNGTTTIRNSKVGSIQNAGTLTIGNGAVITGGITSTGTISIDGNDNTIISNENGYGIYATAGTITYKYGTIKGRRPTDTSVGAEYSYYYTESSTGVSFIRAGEEYTVKEGNLYVTKMNLEVASIGSTKYNTLQAAINAAQTGDTIMLEKDITKTFVVFNSSKSITLDLNGHTINHYYSFMSALSSALASPNNMFIVDSGLTIINSSSTSAHITSYEYNSTAIYVRNGSLTIGDSSVSYSKDNITIETNGAYAIYSEGTSLSLYTGRMIVNNPINDNYKEVFKVSDSRNFNVRDGYRISISTDNTSYVASLIDGSIIYKEGKVGVVYKEIVENGVKKLQIILTPNTKITSINQKLFIYLAMWDDDTHTTYTYTKIECTDTTESYPQIPGATWDVKIPISKLPYLYNVNYFGELTVEYLNYSESNELIEVEVAHADLMIVPVEDTSTDIVDKKPGESGESDNSCYKVHTDRDVLVIEICNSDEPVDSTIFSDSIIRDTIFTYIFGAEWKNVITLQENSTIALDDYTCNPGEIGVCVKIVNMTITNISYNNSPTPNSGNDTQIVNAKVLLYVYSPRLNANTQTQSVTTCDYDSECVVSDLEFIDYTGQKVNNVVSYITFDGEIVDFIDTTKVGKYLVTTYAVDRYGYTSKSVIREYNVIDNIAPVVKVNEETIYVKKGHSFVGLDGLEIYDNYDTNLKIERITNEVNFNKAGSYRIGYKVTDTSGNYTIVYRTVVVKGNNYIGYIIGTCAILLAISLLYIRKRKLFSK